MTIPFILFAVLVLIVIFGMVYKIRGLKAALIATAMIFVGFLVLYVGMIYLIVNSMD